MPENLETQLVLTSELRQSIADLRETFRVNSIALQTSQAKTDADLRDMIRENSIALQALQAKSDTDLREMLREGYIALQASQARTDLKFAQTEAQMARTDAKLDRICQQLADIGFSNGDAAEDWFYSSLQRSMRLGRLRFDTIERNIHKKKKRVEDEYDILMMNGDCVALIEVKYKVITKHIETLSTRKIENFRVLFQDYADYKVYVAIAGMSYDIQAEDLAHKQGVAVLKQRGDHLEVNAEGMRAF